MFDEVKRVLVLFVVLILVGVFSIALIMNVLAIFTEISDDQYNSIIAEKEGSQQESVININNVENMTVNDYASKNDYGAERIANLMKESDTLQTNIIVAIVCGIVLIVIASLVFTYKILKLKYEKHVINVEIYDP